MYVTFDFMCLIIIIIIIFFGISNLFSSIAFIFIYIHNEIEARFSNGFVSYN